MNTKTYTGIKKSHRVTVNGNPLHFRGDNSALFNWGYTGLGTAPLAAAILSDYYGDNSENLKFYRDFQLQVIANLKDDWTLTGDEVAAAIEKIKEAKQVNKQMLKEEVDKHRVLFICDEMEAVDKVLNKQKWDFEQNFNSALYHLENGLEFFKAGFNGDLAITQYREKVLENLETALGALKEADKIKRVIP